MATYYVANYGSNSNNGTNPATPWLTLGFALGVASGTNPGLTAGDTVWIAPGTYREVVTTTTLTGTSGNTIKIYGDPTFTRTWTSGVPGRVRLTNFLIDTVLPTASATLAVIGDYIDVQDLCIDGQNVGNVSPGSPSNSTLYLRGGNITVTRCSVQTSMSTSRPIGITWWCNAGKNNLTIDRCSVFAVFGIYVYSDAQTATFDANAVIKDTFVMSGLDFGIVFEAASPSQVTGARVYNTTITGGTQAIFFSNWGQVGGTTNVLRNNLIYSPKNIGVISNSSITITQSNNSIFASTNFTSVLPNTNNISAPMFDFGSSRVQAFSMLPWFAQMSGSPLIGAGTATGAPTVDLYGNTWTTFPTIGAIESKTESDVGSYVPIERNASAISVPPGETSRTLYIYLGSTGITHATTNLLASYTRNGQAPVTITLVAQTPTGSYISGGFCEVSAPYARGTYRLDVPNAAFTTGADDVTIFVGGANTTNGAVITCNMQVIAGNIVHIGPFKVIADGLGSDQPLDIVQGVQAPVSVQLVDANENGVDISGATVEAKVYNAIGSLIATYSCVPVYAADGRCTFQLTTSVTNTAGVYNVTLTRTIGGNIVVFGPMKMIVRAN